MQKVVEITRKDGYKDIKAKCDKINKYESNIELVNPNYFNSDGRRVDNMLIPLDTIDLTLVSVKSNKTKSKND